MKATILCATNFSVAADEATHAAAAMAQRLHRDLELVHVLGSASRYFANSKTAAVERRLKEVATHQLRERAKALKWAGVPVKSRVLGAVGKATVADTLRKHVRQVKPRLVVTGTHSRGDAAFWPIGSFAETLAESLDAPVLVVHSAEPFQKWAEGKAPLRVCAGVDISKDALPVLAVLKMLRDAGDCQFGVTHVKHYFPAADSILSAWDATPESLESLADTQMKLKQLVRRHVGPRIPSSVEIAVFSTGSHLIDFADSENADLLVVGTHHRGHLARLFMGSVSRRVLRYSEVNVLCVPVKQAAGAGAAAKRRPAQPIEVPQPALP